MRQLSVLVWSTTFRYESRSASKNESMWLTSSVILIGGLCGGVFIDEAFETMCKSRLGSLWTNLSQAGIKELMKQEWEYAVKPQFRLGDSAREYIVAVPAEAFKGQGASALTDLSKRPFIKNGRIHFARYGPWFYSQSPQAAC
jgi:hypothetical protein